MLAEIIRQRPTQCAAAIDALLDHISPPVTDQEELGLRGQALAQLALSSAEAIKKVVIGPPYPSFEAETPAATLDAVRRLIEVEREARIAGADAILGAKEPDSPLYVAQMLRLALEEPRRRYFVDPDAYSGAKWAKAIGANGRLDYFLAGMVALDPSGDLARHFANLHDALSATGHRLPVTREEQTSYASLINQGA